MGNQDKAKEHATQQAPSPSSTSVSVQLRSRAAPKVSEAAGDTELEAGAQWTITPEAVAQALAMAKEQGIPALMRLGVRGGGCTGFSYVFEFTEDQRANDIVLDTDGLRLVCDPKSLRVLKGMEIDYASGLLQGGFRFSNPNAKRNCSCGESFSLA